MDDGKYDKYIKSKQELEADAHQHHDAEKPVDPLTGLADMLHAAAYSAIEKPLQGTAQIVNHMTGTKLKPDPISAPVHDNTWTTAGNIAGSVVDYYAISKVGGAARSAIIGRSVTVPILEAGMTGAAYEFSQPVAEDNDFAKNKFRNALLGFGTFATMDGVSTGLKSMEWLKDSRSLLTDVGVNATSGAAGGFTHSVMEAELNHKDLNFKNIANDMTQYATFGAMFAPLDYGMGAAGKGIKNYFQAKADAGEPLVQIGGIEIHPRGYAQNAREFAVTDGLTGLKNKTGGAQALDQEVNHAYRDGDPLSMTYLDLDNFKTVNDKFGHKQGDRVLTKVADLIKDAFKRGTDIHVREGGDEFMVIMPNTPLDNALPVANNFEANMRLGVGRTAPEPKQLAENFPPTLKKITALPRTATGEPTETLTDLAERLLQQRMSLTGETFDAASILSETMRLAERTGLKPSDSVSGVNLTVYNEADIARLGDKAGHRFVPQIGQFLKSHGITEAQIQDALGFQKTFQPGDQPLLGEALVSLGHATPEQVQKAFGEQMNAVNSVKETLARVFGTPKPAALPDDRPLTPQEIAKLRLSIPQVYRPQLEPDGVRLLQPFEPPTSGEVVVGASTGVVQYNRGETADAFKKRGDDLMFDKKEERKAKGLRHDRNAAPTAQPSPRPEHDGQIDMFDDLLQQHRV